MSLKVVELSADEYDRLLKTRIRELETALKRYCTCRHGSVDCFCTLEARAAMFEVPVPIVPKKASGKA